MGYLWFRQIFLQRKRWRLYGNYQYDDCNSYAFTKPFLLGFVMRIVGKQSVNAIILANFICIGKYF